MSSPRIARDWLPVLAPYRVAETRRSLLAMVTTFGPFLALWALAWWSLQGPMIVTLGLSILIGSFLMRVFCLQHDCGHGSFFQSRKACDRLGGVLGIITITPYAVWREVHDRHHRHSGNLDVRDMGEIRTLTIEEYRARTPLGRLRYRIYRNPISLFVVGPFWLFFMQNRLPLGLMNAGRKYWISAMGTNLGIAAILGVMYYFGGWAPILLIFLPSTFFAAFAGVWTFYMHHQFDGAHFDYADDWQVHDAALHGSSQVVLPSWLQWITANISLHHVHHLYARIPFYRLPEVLRDHPELADINRISLRESLAGLNMKLWDPNGRRLVSFGQARSL
ncbi:MAG: fatty acid desaturase [Roseovarius sp.]